MEFKPFPEIKKLSKVDMSITQKIHGTNAQVFIVPLSIVPLPEESSEGIPRIEVDGEPYNIFCGSRTRWITPEKDNYGFASFVYANVEEFIRKLGPGQHFGEWAGPGINSGEGLKEKTFVLFDFWRFTPERPLPPQCCVVPVLYQGPMNLEAVATTMQELKTNGSKLVPGFNRPEGVVINAMGTRFKKVFEAEETSWKGKDPNYVKPKKEQIDCSHLMQPIRLEKLLSREEQFTIEFPKSLPKIVDAYIQDLIKEDQITGSEAYMGDLRTQSFQFVRITLASKI